jgi:hypothetical protein
LLCSICKLLLSIWLRLKVKIFSCKDLFLNEKRLTIEKTTENAKKHITKRNCLSLFFVRLKYFCVTIKIAKIKNTKTQINKAT